MPNAKVICEHCDQMFNWDCLGDYDVCPFCHEQTLCRGNECRGDGKPLTEQERMILYGNPALAAPSDPQVSEASEGDSHD